jgi:hypothetical protein
VLAPPSSSNHHQHPGGGDEGKGEKGEEMMRWEERDGKREKGEGEE